MCMVAIAVLDFLYQWWQYEMDLRMTKQEVKEEYKETEGNPETSRESAANSARFLRAEC